MSRIARYSQASVRAVKRLADSNIDTFRDEAFNKCIPALLPSGYARHMPAIHKWFTARDINRPQVELERAYLSAYAQTMLPMEIYHNDTFQQVQLPLSFLLDHASGKPGTGDKSRASVYIAQASLSDLPVAMQSDVPTPSLVTLAGRGDVYASSLWLGMAPTYTPLHRDPNPNLFIQLAGVKRVRLLPPEVGSKVFAFVQNQIGGASHAAFRGQEMMAGEERRILEQTVWESTASSDIPFMSELSECELNAGDALFIPKGWWHSIKGVGSGMIGSVNWWFR